MPCALTVAGSDSGGGAGVQADLKAFAALGVHGTCVVTSVTAQNPDEVLGIEPCTPAIILRQLEAVLRLHPAAVKTGMLYSEPIIEAVCEFLRLHRVPLVVDPVMVSTSGAALLKKSAVRALCRRLIPLATIVTPNVPETELLLGSEVRDVGALREAAHDLHARFGCAALVKGGHLRGMKEAVDIYYDGETELLLQAPFVKGVHTHGTGCTYSAAIAACLAREFPLPRAVAAAKEFITQAIACSRVAGGHSVLNWFAPQNLRANRAAFR